MAGSNRWKSSSVKPQCHRNQNPLPRRTSPARCARASRACRCQASVIIYLCVHTIEPAAYGKIQPRFPCHREQTRGGPDRTVSRLQGYPVSRASEPRELPYGDYPMARTRKDRQGLPVVNGRRSFCRPVSDLPRYSVCRKSFGRHRHLTLLKLSRICAQLYENESLDSTYIDRNIGVNIRFHWGERIF